mgnify:CR=1 FL=1
MALLRALAAFLILTLSGFFGFLAGMMETCTGNAPDSLLGFIVGSTYGTDLQASYRQVAGLIMLFFGTFLWLVVVRPFLVPLATLFEVLMTLAQLACCVLMLWLLDDDAAVVVVAGLP